MNVYLRDNKLVDGDAELRAKTIAECVAVLEARRESLAVEFRQHQPGTPPRLLIQTEIGEVVRCAGLLRQLVFVTPRTEE